MVGWFADKAESGPATPTKGDGASSSATTTPVVWSAKGKSLTKLPMPPGIKQSDFESIDSSPNSRSSSPEVPKRKKGIKDLPMPPVVAGSEDLSADEDMALTPPRTNKLNVGRAAKGKLRRPRILHKRRQSRGVTGLSGAGRDWGERCVDVFEVITQIGEGTYGQVYKAQDKRAGELVALKKVRLENEKEGFPITAVREIKILRQLNHKNIVNLREIVTDKQDALDFRKVIFTFPFGIPPKLTRTYRIRNKKHGSLWSCTSIFVFVFCKQNVCRSV